MVLDGVPEWGRFFRSTCAETVAYPQSPYKESSCCSKRQARKTCRILWVYYSCGWFDDEWRRALFKVEHWPLSTGNGLCMLLVLVTYVEGRALPALPVLQDVATKPHRQRKMERAGRLISREQGQHNNILLCTPGQIGILLHVCRARYDA